MKENKKIVVGSSLKTECNTFNQWSGEIIIIGTIFCENKEYRDVEILHLNIESDEYDVLVHDVIFPLVPYLKPIRSFRSFLHPILSKLAKHDQWVIRRGAAHYLHELDTFSETKSLLRQARGYMDRIKPDAKGAERLARQILEIAGEVPNTDIHFEVQE
jgi:hypothetical protein